MKRVERMHAILLFLQSKKVVTAQDIANYFGICLRTVYRDIRSLEESGVPIGAEAGLGYFLNDTYTLPPVMFTTEEAFALITAGPFMKSMTDDVTMKSFGDALLKVKAIMPHQQKERLAILETKIAVKTGVSKSSTGNETTFLYSIQQALADNKVLSIEYLSANRSQTTRFIEPLTLCYYMLKWHLIAHCTVRDDIRDFRLDRILSLEITNKTFRKSTFCIDNYFQSSMRKNGWQEIVLLADLLSLETLGPAKYWYGFVEQRETSNGTEIRFLNPDLVYFAKWLITLGPDIQVLSPPELIVHTTDLVKQLAVKYL